MVFQEEQLSGEEKFSGHVVALRVDQARIGDGSVREREVVEHPGGVAILALDEENNVTLVQQYRYPFHQVLLELPAGKLDAGEDHRPAAIRELSEETGLEAGELTYLGCLLASPGFCTERLHMYLARDLRKKESHPDEDEFLLPERIPLDQLVSMALDGTLIDGKSVIGVLKTALLRKGV